MYVHIYGWICIFIHMHMYMCTSVEREREREREASGAEDVRDARLAVAPLRPRRHGPRY